MVHRFQGCPCGYALEQQRTTRFRPLTEESAEKKRNYGTDKSDKVERFQLRVSKTAIAVAVAVSTVVINNSDPLENLNYIIWLAI